MKFKAYIDTVIKAAESGGERLTRREVITAVAKKAGVHFGTLAPVDRNGCLVMYDKALAVSEATGWLVNVIELCDPDPDTRLAQILSKVEVKP